MPAWDHAGLRAALEAHDDFDAVAARYLSRRPTLISDDHTLAILEHGDQLFTYRFAEGTLEWLAGPDARR